MAVLRGLDEPLRLGHALRHLGQVQQELGDIDQAEACYTEALALYREFGAAEPLQLANSVRYLAVSKHEAARLRQPPACGGKRVTDMKPSSFRRVWPRAPRDSPCCLPGVETRTTRWYGSAAHRPPRKPLATAR